MPEEHTIHRLAATLDELYGGQSPRVRSPQGHFADGASRLDGQVLLGSQAHGKHLFLPFGPRADMSLDSASVTWLRIYLGLYGAWTFNDDREFTAPHAIGAPCRRVGERGEHALKGGGGSVLTGLNGGGLEVEGQGTATHEPAPEGWEPLEPRGAVRLRLLGEHGVADLTGPAACELLDAEGVATARRRLGSDPLRADGDMEAFVAKARSRRKSIGKLLVDQPVISGAGNIYRAGTLFRVGVSPFRAGNRTGQKRLRAIWEDLRPLMEYGVTTGFITTVDLDDVPNPLPPDDPEAGRWYVYHRTGRSCLRCGTPVAEREVASHWPFWCPTCQAH